MPELNTVKPEESGKLTLSKADRRKHLAVCSHFLCKVLWTTNVCKNFGPGLFTNSSLQKLYTKRRSSCCSERHLKSSHSPICCSSNHRSYTCAWRRKANGAAIDDAAIQGVKSVWDLWLVSETPSLVHSSSYPWSTWYLCFWLEISLSTYLPS